MKKKNANTKRIHLVPPRKILIDPKTGRVPQGKKKDTEEDSSDKKENS